MNKITDKLIALVKECEGCSLHAYLDAVKVPTIGYGNTFYKDGKKVQLGEKITQEQADDLLITVLNKFALSVSTMVKKPLNDNQFCALLDFAYNCGVGNLKSSTLLKKVNANPNDPTIADEFKKWDKAGGKVLAGLTKRRKLEADLYFL